MKARNGRFVTLLAAVMVVSGLSFAPVYAEETEVTEPVATQETVVGIMRDGECISYELNASGQIIARENKPFTSNAYPPWDKREIHSVDELVQEFGASNVSKISDTEIRLLKDIQYPEDKPLDLAFYMPELTIDFNGYACKGLVGFTIVDGNVTTIDSSGNNSGGIRSSVLEVDKNVFYAPYCLAADGGSLTIKSGKYTSSSSSVYGYEGKLSIQGGVFGEANNISEMLFFESVDIFAGMSSASIIGGNFSGYLEAVYCHNYDILAPENHVQNPLKIYGGSFSCSEEGFGAVMYEDINIGADIKDILGTGCYLVPATTYQINNAAYIQIYTEKNVKVELDTSKVVGSFVYRLYKKVLQREPDSTGLLNWVKQLNEKTISGSDAAYGFFFSPELTKRNLTNEEFVTLLYNTFFDRNPDTGGMKTWLSALESGASRKYVFGGFANSQEWKNLCAGYGIEPGSYTSDEPRDQNMKVTAFVQRLYNLCLNRGADVDGLNNWTKALNSQSQDGAHVAYGFFFSQEFIGRKLSNADYVEVLYKVLLGRGSDPTGKADWVKQLDDGTARMDIFRGFVHSQEFDKICADYGIVRGTI